MSAAAEAEGKTDKHPVTPGPREYAAQIARLTTNAEVRADTNSRDDGHQTALLLSARAKAWSHGASHALLRP